MRRVGDDELRWMLLGEADRQVRKAGIRFHGIDFIAPDRLLDRSDAEHDGVVEVSPP